MSPSTRLIFESCRKTLQQQRAQLELWITYTNTCPNIHRGNQWSFHAMVTADQLWIWPRLKRPSALMCIKSPAFLAWSPPPRNSTIEQSSWRYNINLKRLKSIVHHTAMKYIIRINNCFMCIYTNRIQWKNYWRWVQLTEALWRTLKTDTTIAALAQMSWDVNNNNL